MCVEVLLVVRGQAQALEPSVSGVTLGLFHQSPAVTPATLGFGDDDGFYKQTAAVTYDLGQPGVAEQPLALRGALQENQADGKILTGLQEGVDSGGLAPLPLRVDQVCAWHQQVRAEVDGNGVDLLRTSTV